MDKTAIRCGKIGYLNVLPLCYPLEAGIVSNSFAFASGPPAQLNEWMAAGELDVSATSSIEYARRPERYFLVPDLAIGSRGPVQSVLLLAQRPIESLDGAAVAVTSQTHTSAALLKILFKEYLPLDVRLAPGRPVDAIRRGERPTAVLAIGDDALRLRRHPDYPYVWDLGEVWRQWTGRPFIFGVWVLAREFGRTRPEAAHQACAAMLAAKAWGLEHMDRVVALAAKDCFLSEAELHDYFSGLVYDLGAEERAGLTCFYEHLAACGEIPAVPALEFFDL